jgi:hypothetical protein
MFCSNCGAGEQSADAYCKRCGEWIYDARSLKKRSSATPEDKMKMVLVFDAISAVFALLSSIALYANHLGKPGVNWSVYVAAAFCLSISVYQTINFFYLLQLRSRLKRGRADAGNVLGQTTHSERPALNEAHTTDFLSARSVTESTTELLDPVPRVPQSDKARR